LDLSETEGSHDKLHTNATIGIGNEVCSLGPFTPCARQVMLLALLDVHDAHTLDSDPDAIRAC